MRVKKRLLSYKEASEYMGISVSNLKRLAKAGVLPTIKIGKRRLFDLKDIDVKLIHPVVRI